MSYIHYIRLHNRLRYAFLWPYTIRELLFFGNVNLKAEIERVSRRRQPDIASFDDDTRAVSIWYQRLFAY
jgi:hypothetical protein